MKNVSWNRFFTLPTVTLTLLSSLAGCAEQDGTTPVVGDTDNRAGSGSGAASNGGAATGNVGNDGAGASTGNTGNSVSSGGDGTAGSVVQEPDTGIIQDDPNDEVMGPTGIRPGDAVDMLIVVDNSTSMGDKQAVFKDAVPDILDQMVNPPCFNTTTQEFAPFDENGKCGGANIVQVFPPVEDIHIAIISSSLGSHGLGADQIAESPVCDDNTFEQNDKAHLMPSVRPEAQLDAASGGFLVWDSAGFKNDAAQVQANLDVVVSQFQAQVDAVGESGCGFEAPLEAAYRFLVEPNPYAELVRGECKAGDGTTACVRAEGTDEDLLAQRAAFLRPDSHVVVIFLTDENDCSVLDRKQGYYTLRPTPMAGSSLKCDEDPNDPCCHSCAVQTAPDGCDPDPATNGCNDRARDALESANDTALSEAFNLRCYDQKRRFGSDFLYPTQRYVDGFQADQIPDRDNKYYVENPLFAQGRTPEQVFVVGIVGVPWQDTAEDPNAPAGTLKVKRTADLDWSLFLPVADVGNAEPVDPFNIETMAAADRAGKVHPITNDAIGGVDSWNAINGHDRDLVSADGKLDDLQYACIFPLKEPKDCAAEDADETTCDCTQVSDQTTLETIDYAAGNPLCRNPEDGTYGTMQYFAKAYPAPRMLEVLYNMDQQGVLSSICPRNATEPELQDFGYRPAIRALLLAVAPPTIVK